MEGTVTDFDRILNLSRSLTSVEKVKLIKHLSTDIENTLLPDKPVKKSLKGLFKDCCISSEDIDDIKIRKCGKIFPGIVFNE